MSYVEREFHPHQLTIKYRVRVRIAIHIIVSLHFAAARRDSLVLPLLLLFPITDLKNSIASRKYLRKLNCKKLQFADN